MRGRISFGIQFAQRHQQPGNRLKGGYGAPFPVRPAPEARAPDLRNIAVNRRAGNLITFDKKDQSKMKEVSPAGTGVSRTRYLMIIALNTPVKPIFNGICLFHGLNVI